VTKRLCTYDMTSRHIKKINLRKLYFSLLKYIFKSVNLTISNCIEQSYLQADHSARHAILLLLKYQSVTLVDS
jgi:phage-related holin